MPSKLFRLGIFLCLAAAFVQAQDPIKVEPKHYKLNFENEHVQVVSVHYGPHEKSVLHEHPGGVVVALTEAHLLFTDEKGKTREVYSKRGEAHWYPAFKHRVENLGDTPYDAVYIAIKNRVEVSSNSSDPTTTADEDEETSKLVAQYLVALGAH